MRYITKQNGDIFIQSGKREKGPYTFDNLPNIRYAGGGLRPINTIPNPGESLLDRYPDVANELLSFEDEKYKWLSGKDICVSMHATALFKCSKCGYMWKTLVLQRTNHGCGCPCCASHRQQSKYERQTFDKLSIALLDKGYILRKHVFLRDLVKQSGSTTKSNFDMCIPEIKTCIEFNGYFTHSSENKQISDAFKEEWCKNNGFKLIVIRTNPTTDQPIKKHVVDNITYYDINNVTRYDINDEISEKKKAEIKIVNNRFSKEIDEVIRDIVSNID